MQYPMVHTSFAWHELVLAQCTRQLPSTQSLPAAQSLAALQLPGGFGLQMPDWQLSPLSQSPSVLHAYSHALFTHQPLVPQSALCWHDDGGVW
jgi:hypothetical protein